MIDTTRQAVRDVVGPVQDLADEAINPTVDFFDGLGKTGALRRENRVLRERLARSRTQLAQAKVSNARIKELEGLLDIPQVSDSDAIAATIVGSSVGSFERTFRIDRGTDAGVRERMPVVVGTGLVGQVIAVSKTSATVRRIDDRRFSVGVRLVEAQGLGALGIADGQSDNSLLRLSFLPAGTEVEKGQTVVTSGLSSEAYPALLPVGTIERVSNRGVANACATCWSGRSSIWTGSTR